MFANWYAKLNLFSFATFLPEMSSIACFYVRATILVMRVFMHMCMCVQQLCVYPSKCVCVHAYSCVHVIDCV